MNQVQITRPNVQELLPRPDADYVDVHGVLDVALNLVCPRDPAQPSSNILLNSAHGMGKTLAAATLALKIGERLGKPVPIVVYDCSEDTRNHHLLGSSHILPDGTTSFVLGPFPLAIELANEVGFCILNAEEISALTPGAQKQFNAMTDWRRSVFVPQLGRHFHLQKEARLAVVGTMNPCFHPDTEVLTPNGIKSIEALHTGDPIYSFDVETGTIEIDFVEQIWCEPCTHGLLHIEGNTCDLLITPNHKLVWKRQGVDMAWRLDEAQDIADKRVDLPKPFDLPLSGNRYADSEVVDLKNVGLYLTGEDWSSHKTQRTAYRMMDLCRLLGWYVADGSLYYDEKKQDYRVCITKYRTTQPVRGEIEEMLRRAEIPFADGKRDIVISDKLLFHAMETLGGQLAARKKIHPWVLTVASRDHLRALFDAAYSCDGRNSPNRHGDAYSTKSPQLRDAMTWIANVLGYATSWGFDSGIHRVTLSDQRRASAPKHHFKPVEYRGMVINLSVKKNHTLFAGRNGRFVAVGNSAYGGVYTLNADLRSRFDEIQVPTPTIEQEKRILGSRCPRAKPVLVEKACQLAKESRTDATEYKISTRDLVQLVQNITKLGDDLKVPLQLLANKFEEGTERNTIADRIRAVFGVSV